MKLTVEQFRAWEHKNITLVGMSGVGKTHLSNMLRRHDWFHYSGDYRIGTRYLSEPILDIIKKQAMEIPMLRELLRSDYISIRNRISIDNLGPVLSFVGKLGNPELGGVPLREFRERQELYRRAEIRAMRDVPGFINKARNVFGYKHFVNDVGGSLCELEEPGVIDLLIEHTLILYIEVSKSGEAELLRRAEEDPKPLYYRPRFLNQHLAEYLEINELPYAALIDPDDFTRWIFPRLFHSRIPRYEEIAAPYGYTVTADEVAALCNDRDFLDLLETAIERDDLPQAAAAS
ncbi:ATPase [Pseudomonadota bacterium]